MKKVAYFGPPEETPSLFTRTIFLLFKEKFGLDSLKYYTEGKFACFVHTKLLSANSWPPFRDMGNAQMETSVRKVQLLLLVS